MFELIPTVLYVVAVAKYVLFVCLGLNVRYNFAAVELQPCMFYLYVARFFV